MKKALVVGASGGIGYALVQELISRGVKVVAFSRGRSKLENLYQKEAEVTIFAGDVFNRTELMDAAKGVDVIFHAVSFPYPEWSKTHVQCLENIIHVAEVVHSKVVLVDNIYAYGSPNNSIVTEDADKQPKTKKGLIRLEMENKLKNSGITSLIVHLPDLYGPNATNTIFYQTLKNIVKDKKTIYIGHTNVSREFIYSLDGAKAVVELSLLEDTYNQNWNVPSAHPITGEKLISMIREMTGYNKSVKVVSKNMIRFLGVFSPAMREMVEMMYLTEKPVILSGEKYEKKFQSLPRTPYRVGIQETLDWMIKRG